MKLLAILVLTLVVIGFIGEGKVSGVNISFEKKGNDGEEGHNQPSIFTETKQETEEANNVEPNSDDHQNKISKRYKTWKM